MGIARLGMTAFFARAKILGQMTIGDGASIGANAVALVDVSPGQTAIGIPAKIAAAN
ncbi:MAG: hypothetical protein ACRC8A_20065 [Microcoleaceae cyanobacterium]